MSGCVITEFATRAEGAATVAVLQMDSTSKGTGQGPKAICATLPCNSENADLHLLKFPTQHRNTCLKNYIG